MKRALLFLALSLGLKAQTLAGLPERGISLTGDWRNPILENHSGKTILATLLLQVNAKSKKMASMGFFIPAPTSEGGIKPGATKAILGNMANPPGFYTVVVGPAGFTDSPIVSAELSAVVFADGELELRGADIFGFQKSIERALAAIVGCGNMARADQWLELEARAQSQDNSKFESMHEQGSAKDLVFLRNWKSEIAARDLGDRFRTLPTKLWRKGQ